MKIKYALLTLDENTEYDGPISFGERAYLIGKKLEEFALHQKERTKHWREWLGTLRWKEINNCGLTFVVWCPTDRPEVLDKENQELEGRITCAWYSMLVSHCKSPHWSEHASVKLSGSGDLVDGQVVPDDIRSYSTKPILVRPMYDRSRSFMEAFPYKWKDTSWIDNWKVTFEIMSRLQTERKVNSAFFDLLESFQSSRTTGNVTTKISRLVEATEAIVGLPQSGGGRQVFADRCLKILAKNHHNDLYLRWTNDELRRNLVRNYQIRINRNHGKGMSDHIPEVIGGDRVPELDSEKIEAALEKLSYLAETTAKEAIQYVLRNPDKFDLLKTRAELERTWSTGTFV